MIQFKPSRILIPVDFSETSLLAVKHGVFLAKYTKAELHLLHVVNLHYDAQDIFLPYVQVNQSEIENKAMEKLKSFSDDLLNEHGIRSNCIIRTGSPSFEIISVAHDLHISLIVMGTHGYSPIQEFMIGSVALKVLSKSPCPTMVMSHEADHLGYSRIVLPIDTSAHTRQKVNYAVEFAKVFNASLHAVGLLGANEENEKASLELILKQIGEIAGSAGVNHKSLLLSQVKNRASASLQQAEDAKADLIIIMSDQEAEMSGLFLGPYAQQIIYASKVPVIAIKPRDLSANDGSILSGTSGL
ncbi:MAG TPA: universal stress protein [Bacteroidia bacterium]|nr:universal stress protein [Bacteroidia bacterium]